MQLEVGDWLRDPQLSMCSPATRGIWFDLLCVLHELGRSGQVTGTPEQICRTCRCTPAELVAAIAELSTTGAADIHDRNGVVTIINRRMQREHKERVMTAERVRRHRSNGEVTEGKHESNKQAEKSLIDINTLSQEENSSKEKDSLSLGKKTKIPPDPRSKHPAIVACRATVGRYPDKSLYDDLILVLGDEPDLEKLKACRQDWVKRGYNPSAWTWAIDWYRDGIPQRPNQNGANQNGNKSNGNNGNNSVSNPGECEFKAAITI
jgi:hypothetical protein